MASSSSAAAAAGGVAHVRDARYLPPGQRPERTRVLVAGRDPLERSGGGGGGFVAYWMTREVRTRDNPALAWARHLAGAPGADAATPVPLHVLYALPPPPPPGQAATAADGTAPAPHPPPLERLPWTRRYADFALGGLAAVHRELADEGIPLHVVLPGAREDGASTEDETVGAAVYRHLQRLGGGDAGRCLAVVCDFHPLRPFRQWTERELAPLLAKDRTPLWQMDGHNIVPVWAAAPSRMVGARTLRPRIHKVLRQYLKEEEPASATPGARPAKAASPLPAFDRARYEAYLRIDESVPSPAWAVPGTAAALARLEAFVAKGLPRYDTLRNDPTHAEVCSDLSPWINHGHIAFATIARHVMALNRHANGTAGFLEEGIVRRELSDNYVYYTPDGYDSLAGAADWARQTLREHAADPRDPAYSLAQLERGQTADDLWNAAQLQLVREGRMHGFLRMYWAKKVLEWTREGPAAALARAQYLNDQYALDGRDPNGFVGVGWSIMGVHDMGWKERPIFGKIRYMNYAGCKRKFNVAAFVARYKGAAENAAKAAREQPGGASAPYASAAGPATKKQKTLDKFTKK